MTPSPDSSRAAPPEAVPEAKDPHRRDLVLLGDVLAEVITELAGATALEAVEGIRRLAEQRRSASPEAEKRLAERIAAIDVETGKTIARALSIYFDLANIAEDRQRVRVLRRREASLHPNPLPESLGAAVQELAAAGRTAAEVQAAIDRLRIELVFTAHPSEAKRRSIRAKLRRLRRVCEELDRDDLLPRERERLRNSISAELRVIWQTEFLRPVKPTVLDEVERGLSVLPRLKQVVPRVRDAFRRALAEHYPGHSFAISSFLTFGSWMGGDRDGNPFVTADVTARTLCRLREAAIDMHLEECDRLYDFLTISLRHSHASKRLLDRLESLVVRFPELADSLEGTAAHEAYRRWIRMIRWRLERSRVESLETPPRAGCYAATADFEADVATLCGCLREDHDEPVLAGETGRWLDLVESFGLRVGTLDVRQDSRAYEEILAAILKSAGICGDYASLDDAAKAAVLAGSLEMPIRLDEASLPPLAADTVRLYRTLHAAAARFGAESLGGSIVSLTRSSADVLSVLWLWKHSSVDGRLDPGLRIVPLFEKIGDLERAAGTLVSILDEPAYAAYLSAQGNRQLIMVGYSDSTKDGGYLSACWGLYEAQSEIAAVAAERGVKVTFFHGRGGALGRGGGPAARGILSLPPESLDGTLRLTEQGEVLAERYDDVHIAFRHLEQVTWATLTGSAIHRSQPSPRWIELVSQLASRSYATYRELVEQPGFIDFFSTATPIDEIENLPIGSRPSRRRGERTLDDLRAIPWVFAWTQNRCIIPAWYGLGTSLLEVKYEDRHAWQTVREMYCQWPFFTATIDNAVLALAKADMAIAQRYAELTDDLDVRRRIWHRIAAEYDRSKQAVLDVVGEQELLSSTPWLKKSIDARNPSIDPLNLIQADFLERRRKRPPPADPSADDPIRELLRLCVQGIASGMRTTG